MESVGELFSPTNRVSKCAFEWKLKHACHVKQYAFSNINISYYSSECNPLMRHI